MKTFLTATALSLALIGSAFANAPAHRVKPSPAPVTTIAPVHKGPVVTSHPRLVRRGGVWHCDKFLFFPRHCYVGRRWL